jgi:eukaryotic-like serine/threonine-protein kinase
MKRLFEQEAKILQQLGSHSQIPQILDYFAENEQFYLVQEWIDGQNLKQELKIKQTLTEKETINLLQDVLEILNFVHQNNYIHRDIKPENLIRNKYDQKIYLIDFGAVKEKIWLENEKIGSQEKAQHTIAIGTPGYMPIEQERGMPIFASDIYALGIVAIQTITGISPKFLVLDDEFNPIWRERIPTSTHKYDPNLLNLIDKMVRGYHSKRYKSTTEVLQDLQQIRLNLEQFPESFSQNQAPIVTNNKITRLKKPLSLLSSRVALGLGTIAIAAIGILSLSTKQQYVAYENSRYGVKLERPENWSLQEEDDFLKPGVILLAPQENNQDKFRETVKISVENLSTPLSLNEYTKQSIREIKKSNTIIEQPQDITFANREGIKVIYQGQDGMKKMEVWMIKNKKAYIATYTAEANKFNKYAKSAETIIQSLVINR